MKAGEAFIFEGRCQTEDANSSEKSLEKCFLSIQHYQQSSPAPCLQQFSAILMAFYCISYSPGGTNPTKLVVPATMIEAYLRRTRQ